jgi:hypothetical protein
MVIREVVVVVVAVAVAVAEAVSIRQREGMSLKYNNMTVSSSDYVLFSGHCKNFKKQRTCLVFFLIKL